MYEVTNTSHEVKTFNVRDNRTGALVLHRLKPGESGVFNIDPNQKRFQPGSGLVASAVEAAVSPPRRAPRVRGKGITTAAAPAPENVPASPPTAAPAPVAAAQPEPSGPVASGDDAAPSTDGDAKPAISSGAAEA